MDRGNVTCTECGVPNADPETRRQTAKKTVLSTTEGELVAQGVLDVI